MLLHVLNWKDNQLGTILIYRKDRYLSYLLRMWQESDDSLAPEESPQWRASHEEPKTSQRLWFASLGDLCAYIEKKTGAKVLNVEPSGEENSQP